MALSSAAKSKIIELIVEKLEKEIAVISESVKAAHEAATHEESKAEDQHDTRGLEASYLAGAQAGRAAEFKRLVSVYKFLPLKDFKLKDPIAPGALIEVEQNGKRSCYFLVPQGGGLAVQWEGRTIHVITPQAPLGDALMGKVAGDSIEVETQGATREYEVIGVF